MAAIHPLYHASEKKVELDPELRGRPLFDATGARIGHVADVWVEERPIDPMSIQDTQFLPRYLEVSSGGFFHIGERKALVPVHDVTIDSKGVHLKGSRLDLFGAEEIPAPGGLEASPRDDTNPPTYGPGL